MRTLGRIVAGRIGVLAFAVCVLAFAPARAAWALSPIEVSRLEIRYVGDAEGLPPLRDLLYEEVELVVVDGALDAPGMGSIVQRFRLFEVVQGRRSMLTSDGLDVVLDAIAESLVDRGASGLEVRPAPEQVERVGGVWNDRRRGGSRLTIQIMRPIATVAPEAVPTEPGATAEAEPAVPLEGPPVPDLVPLPSDGDAFELTRIVLEYARDHPGHPAIEMLLNTPVTLAQTPDGMVAPRAYGPVVAMPIGEIGADGPTVLYGSAIAVVSAAVVERLRDAGLVGMYVVPAPDAIPSTQQGFVDQREGATGPFPFVIYTAIVTRVGSSATGDRIPLEERIDHPYHRRIRENSPVRPFEPASVAGGAVAGGTVAGDSVSGDAIEGEPGADAAATDVGVEPESADVEPTDAAEPAEREPVERFDLLREDVLNAYAQRLNRHPGRRVDVAIAPGQEDFEAELQYLVREDKPWTVFLQLSNTGTESTSEFRQRLGFVHTQFTNADDILSLDFTTSEFDSANAFSGSYERPLFGSDRFRWRVSGGYNEFTAADVGTNGEAFEGESFFFSGELIGTVFQLDELFIDAYAGARYQDIEVTDLSEGATGPAQEAIFLPRVGLRASRFGAWSNISATAQIEWTINELTGATQESLQELGRIGPEEEWAVFSGSLNASVFLEPLLNFDAWSDPSTPESSTLAHEISFRLGGQYSFDERLIPNAEGVIGGLFTVRGYPESAVAGDSTLFGSVEYRFHVPRSFGIDPEPSTLFGRPFRAAPQQVYGAPDWDLVLKTFFDFGQSTIAEPLGFEQDETLLSAGVGLELQLYRNLSFRTDWAVVLSDIGSDASTRVDSGDQRVHLLFTLAF